jgi:hypothetical protein
MGQGRDNAVKWLKERPEIVKSLRTEVLAKAMPVAKPAAVEGADALAADATKPMGASLATSATAPGKGPLAAKPAAATAAKK